jgi:hypothetical protein
VIPATLDKGTHAELKRYENNYKALNLITTALGRNVYDRVSHLETAHDVWLKLCNTYEGSSEIKSSHKDTYNRQYQTFSQKPRESLDDCFTRFELIVSNLCSCDTLAYSDNECAKQLLYTLECGVTLPTSSPTAPRGRSSTPPTSATIQTGMTSATRVTTRRSTALETRRRRRSSRRSCPQHVLPRATLTSSVTTPPAQTRMRTSSVRNATSPAFASWENLRDTSLTRTPM